MKAKVEDTCIGCGLCSDTCSEVFEMKDDLAVVIGEVVPDDAVDSCEEAAENCPVDAIILEE